MPMAITVMFLWVSWFLVLNSINIHGQRFMELDECSTLSALKQSLIFDTEVSSKLVSWNSSMECCSWSGVTCENGLVVGLDLSREGISGGLDNSSSLFDLLHLKTLNLGYNRFSTQIPAAIGRLINLENLILCYARFVGEIPVGIAGMTKLRSLDLSVYIYTNPLQFALLNLTSFVRNLSNLEELRLDGVNISCQGSEWSRAFAFSLPNLRVLSMSDCNLFGPPDPSLLRLQNLSSITLRLNSFSSPFPEFLLRLPKLATLDLGFCQIQGTIPQNIFSIPSLEYLDISDNFLLQGHLPEFSANGSLHTLNLHNTKFSGNLPSSISNLFQLSKLDLSECTFNGELPYLRVLSMSDCNLFGPPDPSLLRLQNLSSITLRLNSFSSPFPEFLLRLPKLATLDLGFCQIQGTIPQNIFSIPSLEYLDISDNFLLQGHLPEFSANGSLHTLNLHNTKFSGNLPSSISNLFQLSKLDLSECTFNGELPSSIQNLIRLKYLDLSHNMFSGPLPDFSRLRNLSTLILSENSLTGAIPSSLFALPFLENLLLNSNHFSGMLPEFPYALSSPILDMDLSSNNLEGPLPLSLFDFPKIYALDLSFNKFSGNLELSDLAKLKYLRDLSFSYNSLSIGINNLSLFASAIEDLNLASCNLTVFPNLFNHTQIFHLDLSNNHIQGEIPKWIWNANHVNLSYNLLESFERPFHMNHSSYPMSIDLHHNMLSGPLLPILPDSAWYIDYSDNRLNSTIPVEIGDYLSLTQFFSVSNNQIVGTLPLSMCKPNVLRVLDLSNNRLEGTIPQCLFNMSSGLVIMNLSRNKLEGTVPGTFPQGCNLRTLDMSRNMVEGEIPRTLANCAGLEVLNLGNNKIHGEFPCWLKGLPNLRVLVLGSNELTGPVQCPDAMNSTLWRSLQIIDLAGNKLSGALPSAFFAEQNAMTVASTQENSVPDQLVYRFSFVYYFDRVTVVIKGENLDLVKILTDYTSVDFSSNMFNGEIPENIGHLTEVHALNLSHNALIGPIPSTLGNMKALESLDLSYNSLDGSIPGPLGQLNFLAFLNLSFNQLEGIIPSGRQIQTFQESSFLGNKGLCGSPVSVKCKDARGSSSTHGSQKVASFLIRWDFMIGSEVGFIVGFVVIIGPLIFYPRWKRYYYGHLDNILFTTFGARLTRGQRRHVSIVM